ncbi:MAG TPA: hypothetical protein VJK03_04835 [Candidatus Nanoarchaeia archaeon]|nr:hypothetical protein [Candidatus Nanoarchaeia archaeon]
MSGSIEKTASFKVRLLPEHPNFKNLLILEASETSFPKTRAPHRVFDIY